MLRLYILRHAKSAWPMPSTGDHDRPLNKRGKNDLPNIASMMVERGYIPDLVFCSSARRTLETWNGLSNAFPESEMFVKDELYESTTNSYFSLVKATAGEPSLLLIGHNPVCDELARLLITGDGDAAAGFIPTHFPTGGLAVLDLDFDQWCDIRPTSAAMVDFVRPRSLRTTAS